MIRNLMRYGSLAGVLVGLAACDLDVSNPNDPGTAEVLATPADAEALLGSYYKRWHAGMYSSSINVDGMAAVQSFENYSSLANSCQNQRGPIPRPANNNSIGNSCSGEQSRVYFIQGEVARVASNILNQLNDPAFALGSAARKLRAQAFAEFLRGLSHGYVALTYDQGAVMTAGLAGDDPGVLVPYTEVMDAALVAFDNAIAHATASAAVTGVSDGFPIPTDWYPTTSTMDVPTFIRVVRSYKARFGANVARTPAERATPPLTGYGWPEIIADATNGITADHNNIMSTTGGPLNAWVGLWAGAGLWHQMPPFIIGMADQSGAYAAWSSVPLDSRGNVGSFFMVTADLRFPQGATRLAQQTDFNRTTCDAPSTRCKRYYVNRPSGSDQTTGSAWGISNYDYVMETRSWNLSGASTARNGPLVFIRKAEMDLLAAEGHIRAGNYPAAATLINNTRTAGMVAGVARGGGLAPVTGAANGGAALATGGDCIPLVPVNVGINGGTTACAGDLAGDRGIFEAMKYEKRLETQFSHFAAWFLDSRGWGDLPNGTPLYWAVPFQDLQARQAAIYDSPGTGGIAGSAQVNSTYGW
ncbi:MAG: hypothetical protein WD801_02775 [Gemmatimonadaceae bacterium]